MEELGEVKKSKEGKKAEVIRWYSGQVAAFCALFI